jgi:hypothetical protein
MKATVDPNRCDIAGICVVICPEVFRFHEGSKKAYVTRSEIHIAGLGVYNTSGRLTSIPNSSVTSKD